MKLPLTRRRNPQKLVLVATPRPAETEGLIGYLLRLSEANGYPSASMWGVVMQETNVWEMVGEILDGYQINRSRLLPVPVAEAPKAKLARSARFLRGHVILNSHLTPLPGTCPICLKEKGVLEAHWEIRQMVACPEHGVHAVTRCPKCKEDLNLSRPSPLTCRCGFNLTEAETYPCRPEEAALLDLVRCKLYGLPIRDSGLGFPPELTEGSLGFLVKCIDRMGRPPDKVKESAKPSTIVRLAAQNLSNWPHNFQSWIKSTGEEEWRSAFRLYQGFAKTRFDMQHYDFVRTALKQHVQSRFNCGFYGNSRDPNAPKTKKPHVLLAELPSPQRASLIRRAEMTMVEASRYLGIPKNICRESIGLGLLRATVEPPNPRISSKSIELLEARFRTVCTSPIAPNDQWLLGAMMLSPHIKTPIKVELFNQVLTRGIKADADGAVDVGRIRVSRSEALAVWKRMKKKYPRALHCNTTAIALGCDPQIIEPMIAAGYLAWEDEDQRVVCEKSLRDFQAKYMLAKDIAKECRTSTWRIVNEFERNNMPVIYFQRKRTKIVQTVVPREYRDYAMARIGRGSLAVSREVRRELMERRKALLAKEEPSLVEQEPGHEA